MVDLSNWSDCQSIYTSTFAKGALRQRQERSMRHLLGRNITAFAAFISSLTMIPLFAATRTDLIEGTAAFGDWRADRSGTRRLIRPQDLTTQDLPAPDRAASANNSLRIVRRTDDQKPIVPNGFEVNQFASGQAHPRAHSRRANDDDDNVRGCGKRHRAYRGAAAEWQEITAVRWP